MMALLRIMVMLRLLLLPAINCALTNAANQEDDAIQYEGRIVGGQATTIQQYPHQVSIQLAQQHICGGAIIGEYFILTAAHCIEQPWNTLGYSVRVGSTQHAEGGQLLSVKNIIRHNQYSPVTHDNDIALLVLNARLNYTIQLKAVPMATLKDALTTEMQLFVSGWGLTSELSESGVSTVLHYVDVSFIPRTICVRSYQDILPISERMFCAGHMAGGRDSCQGDSGGPLVGYRLPEKTFKLYGIVSWGVGCAQKDYPGVYASVAAYRNWIVVQLGALGYRLP